ncbi:MAG: CPBP family intramembrane metalloprotease [Candidatus Nezhaarchaeota archaeon]|nr:CPBP family intramembrane metalloprotease [Candidatus Nezhaarchaeota archaeon]
MASSLYGLSVTSLTAGVCEEVVWRGYLQTRLMARLMSSKAWVAIALQAVLFGLWHSISLHTIFTAAFGFTLGLVYAKTKRLALIMVSHWLGVVIGFYTTYFTGVYSHTGELRGPTYNPSLNCHRPERVEEFPQLRLSAADQGLAEGFEEAMGHKG